MQRKDYWQIVIWSAVPDLPGVSSTDSYFWVNVHSSCCSLKGLYWYMNALWFSEKRICVNVLRWKTVIYLIKPPYTFAQYPMDAHLRLFYGVRRMRGGFWSMGWIVLQSLCSHKSGRRALFSPDVFFLVLQPPIHPWGLEQRLRCGELQGRGEFPKSVVLPPPPPPLAHKHMDLSSQPNIINRHTPISRLNCNSF